MATNLPSLDDAAAERMENAVQVAVSLQRRLDGLYQELARGSKPGGSTEAEMVAVLTERDAAIREIGLAVLTWVLAGGDVQLGEAEPDPAMSRPEPVAMVVDPPTATPDTGEEPTPTAAPDVGVSAEPAEAIGLEPATEDAKPQVAEGPGPEVQPAPPARAKGPPATLDYLVKLGEGLGPKWGTSHEPSASLRLLVAATDQIGPPVRVQNADAFLREAVRVGAAASLTAKWLDLPLEVQRELLALLVAKARYLQDEVEEDVVAEAGVDMVSPVFKRLTVYSKQARPGFVKGLTRAHVPDVGPTWLACAQHWWGLLTERTGGHHEDQPVQEPPEVVLAALKRTLAGTPGPATIAAAFIHAVDNGLAVDDPRLLALAVAHEEHLATEPKLRGLRKAMRASRGAEADLPAEETAEVVDATWPWISVTKNRVAVVVGGDARPEAAQRIRDAFRFSAVEWNSDAQGRKLDGIAARVRNRTVDVVIFLARYGSHRAQGVLLTACKDAGVPFVRLDRGYGVEELRREIEASVQATASTTAGQ